MDQPPLNITTTPGHNSTSMTYGVPFALSVGIMGQSEVSGTGAFELYQEIGDIIINKEESYLHRLFRPSS